MDYLWTPWRYHYVTGSNAPNQRPGVPPELAAWPDDKHCVFCNLHSSAEYGAAPPPGLGLTPREADSFAHIVYRAEHCFVCLNAYPYSPGHVMVIPYVHQHSLVDLDEATTDELMRLGRRAEAVLRAAYSPQGINLGMNLGKAAGAGVDEHLHLHVLPRWFGDTNFMTVTAETRVLPETLDMTWERLYTAFHP